jgi:peptidylprolyl isomerase
MFDSSVARGKPSTFGVARVIPGFSEGLQLMVRGEKRRLWIPEALAYKGQEGRPKGMLVFDVMLIEMPNARRPTSRRRRATRRKRRAASPTKSSRPAPAAGIRSEQPGHGPLHRLDDGREDVRQLGRPRRADDVSAGRRHQGWTEGVALMVEGEKTRFWIPEKLAYDGKQAPYGLLVFDVD